MDATQGTKKEVRTQSVAHPVCNRFPFAFVAHVCVFVCVCVCVCERGHVCVCVCGPLCGPFWPCHFRANGGIPDVGLFQHCNIPQSKTLRQIQQPSSNRFPFAFVAHVQMTFRAQHIMWTILTLSLSHKWGYPRYGTLSPAQISLSNAASNSAAHERNAQHVQDTTNPEMPWTSHAV